MLSLTVVPAYGRDYKSEEEVKKAWEAGKDFLIQDISCRWDGSYVNISDMKNHAQQGITYSSVRVRYKKLRNVTIIPIK
jgi:hypothetical protein